MRIVILTTELAPHKPNSGGLGSFLSRLLPAIAEAGHETVLLYPDNSPTEIASYLGASVVPFYYAMPPWLNLLKRSFPSLNKGPEGGAIAKLSLSWSFAKALEAEHRKKPIDLIHATNLSSSSLFVRRLPQRPIILRSSSDRKLWLQADRLWFGPSARVIDFMETRACKRADLVYAPSRFLTRRLHAKGIKARHLTPPLPDASNCKRKVPDFTTPSRYFIHYGVLGRRKGTETLLAALPQVMDQCPDFQMLWVGKEVQPGFVRDAHRRSPSLSRHLRWLGPVARDVLSYLVANAEWAILPSIADNSPNTVIESLAAGTPVLGTRNSSIDEWVLPGENGQLVEPDDSESLATEIIRLWKQEIPALTLLPDEFLSKVPPFQPQILQQWRDELVDSAK